MHGLTIKSAAGAVACRIDDLGNIGTVAQRYFETLAAFIAEF
jgi:hypothetical protein